MNESDLLSTAREAGIRVAPSAVDGRPWVDGRQFHLGSPGTMAGDGYQAPQIFAALERFAALIDARAVARTREECAKECDDVEEPAWFGYECPNTFQDGRSACAAAIRALGERT